MSEQSINFFAEALVRLVRDRAIRNCSARLNPDTRSPIGQLWLQVLEERDPNRIGEVIIPDCIDEVIFCLLNAIDDGALKLTFQAPNGQNVNLPVEGLGELAGWYMGAENWREQFSEERINDYLS
jgi:hypothetical protein